ncbi:Holin of 3TMs, for gene-transfer release [Loktanella fryxellensis]|uniref:Holin of 3TMs, for gene-transfer release n=1 Tax=Loktanella fryxellensis TaxID=245187 RepID=A0A1H7YM96_9RHOB|nr:holin family protein [Loktanella fryxellensis]SEM47105.1 Holin of 3TMs, for gene-transfer release [Loktanella fryxellensis]
MGVIGKVAGVVLRQVAQGGLVRTVEAFRENTEAGAVRDSDDRQAALAQLAAEFAGSKPGVFDRMIDGLNRLPRPMLALGTLALFASAMTSPDWFSTRMIGVALIPEPLWWLMGAIVSFYFGSRYQAKGQEFQRSVAETVLLGQALKADRAVPPAPVAPTAAAPVAPTAAAPVAPADNAALADWWGQARAD